MNNNYESLTKGQSLLWIGQEINPESPVYNMVMTYDLKIPIDVNHFEKAFEELLYRYDALRSVFVVKEGEPFQLFLQDHNYTLEIVDFSKEQDPIAVYEVWKKDRVAKKFDITTCLLDSVLIKLSTSHYVWYINQHHLITDAWSNGILFSAITNLYQKSKNGESLRTLEVFPSYKDFVNKQKINTKAKEYWGNKIKNSPPVPNLYNKSAINLDTNSNRLHVKLGFERSKKLRLLANEKGVRVWTEHLSLYNIFLTTLFAYLYRVSGQEQLVIGSPTHNRTSKQTKETVGFFVEIFPVFATIDKNETFLSLLKKIQVESNSFLKYATSGASSSDLHRSFNVLFNYINADYPDFNGTPVVSEWVHSGHHDPRHHIRLHVHDLHNTGEIQLYFDVNNHVFDAQTQALIPEHFIALLDAFIDLKDQVIEQPSLLTTKEFKQITDVLNNEELVNTSYTNIITRIEEQVDKSALDKSIVFKQEVLLYKELNRKVNQLAHYLLAQNIGIGSQVAICLKRSSEYIITVLAVLKTGATYIPIPHNYPKDRVTYILEDSKASLFIGHEEKQLIDYKELSIRKLAIDELLNEVTHGYATTNPLINIAQQTTAFIIYTSGSTGNPKGVKITHEALANYINWTKEAYINKHAIEQPNIPLFTTVGFDITANAVFLPLICGGVIHVYQEDNTEVDLSILDVIEDNTIDFIKLTPAHLNFLKGQDLSNSNIKVMAVTGDEFKTELGLYIFNAFKGKVKLYNEYGPSEATIGCIYHEFNPEKDKLPGVPIGLPIDNMQAYILDKYLNPVPQGVVGELYLGGLGLSSGYWDRQDLTDAKFIENPFLTGSKIYRTEDLVRLNSQGILEFLGRTDFQVKINGHRIELGEIEANILSYKTIKNCAVIVIENEEGLKSLAAYFSSPMPVDLKELRAFISQKLPRYMVPVQYKQLENIPLSANGKIDRKILKSINTVLVETTLEYVAPRNEIEQEITDIWCAVFNKTKIGVHDHFIELGGESLMAIQITTRINETFELKIPLNKIFELQTIANISAYLEEVITKILNE